MNLKSKTLKNNLYEGRKQTRFNNLKVFIKSGLKTYSLLCSFASVSKISKPKITSPIGVYSPLNKGASLSDIFSAEYINSYGERVGLEENLSEIKYCPLSEIL